MARRLVLAVLALWSAVVAAQSQAPAFSIERPVERQRTRRPPAAVDAALLAGGAPFRVVQRGVTRRSPKAASSDLRLFDAAGREVPYLLVHERGDRVWRTGRVLPIARDQDHERLRSRLRRHGSDRSGPRRRPSRAVS